MNARGGRTAWCILLIQASASGCADAPTSTRQPDVHPITLEALVVSEAALSGIGESAARTATQAVTWVSLPPGMLPDFARVRIRNVTANVVVETVPIVGGGFDPVAVPASEGDELELTFTHRNGALRIAFLRVPRRRPPTIVRTAPPRGRADVALHVRPAIIFSEPIDRATLHPGSIGLSTGQSVVAGRIEATGQAWMAEFVPDSPLAPSTTYELLISQEVRDLHGDALPESVSVLFTTGPATALSSSVSVSNVTVGGAFDPDGFVVAVDGAALATMELNESVRIDRLPEGTHAVELRDVAANCTVEDGVTRSVQVASGQSSPLRFAVSCTPPPELASIRIAFARSEGSSPGVAGAAIMTMNADGSGRVQLTTGEFNDNEPDISPDGRTIAFNRDPLTSPAWHDPSIHLMNADGTGMRSIVAGPASSPDWSPDGLKFVFSSGGGHWGGPIMVVHASGGTSNVRTGDEDAWPAWSPDGTRIAFTRLEFPGPGLGTLGIWVMNADGGLAEHRIRGDAWGPFGPVWSPDGSRIAFSEGEPYPSGASRIRIMDADGSDVVTAHTSDSWLIVNDWYADGRLLLFTKNVASTGSPRADLFLLDLDDGSITRLTADGAYNFTPTFWPVSPPTSPR